MLKLNNNRTFIHELILPFQGNWHLPWVIQRYLLTSIPGLTPKKFFNASLALIEMTFGKTHTSSKPFVLRIEPTNICNLRCPRCSCGINTDPRKKGYMAMEDFRLIIEENKKNAIFVRLDGNGEPTLHPKIVEMIKIAKAYGYAVSMSTNFNTNRCADVEEFIVSGLDRLIIAIDGSTQANYEKYRVGGNLTLVEERLSYLLNTRKRLGSKKPFTEVQFLDWGYNHNDIPIIRQKVRQLGADKFEVIRPDWAVKNAHANTARPRRCFWLWSVLTLDWASNYHSCTNAWTLPWPRLNLREVPSFKFWNHSLMINARKYNLNKLSEVIASDRGCNCNNCSDMLVVNRPPEYVCQ